MRPLAVIAVLTLPLAGLAANIASNELALAGASEWRIPVTGYDPRDPIRGHYIRFQYDWQVVGDTRLCDAGRDCGLCLEDGGRRVRVVDAATECTARIDVRRSAIDAGRVADGGRLFGRLFVPADKAPTLDAELRAGPMQVVARLGNDGRLVNERLEPTAGE